MEQSFHNNPSAVVTGGGSGLGHATAKRLIEEGYRVTAVDLDEQQTLEAIGCNSTQQLCAVSCDVANADQAESVIDAHHKRWGPPSVLVNCAGIAAPGATLRRDGPQSLDEFRQVIEVNLVGTFNLLRLCASKMQLATPDDDGQRGVIINTSSVAAFDGMVGQAGYAASKGAVAAMTLPLAREFGPFGIRVLAIAPGVFSTPMVHGMPPKSRDIVTAMRPPFPDRLGAPAEFAALVMSMIDNHLLNGEVIRLDGGLRMPPR